MIARSARGIAFVLIASAALGQGVSLPVEVPTSPRDPTASTDLPLADPASPDPASTEVRGDWLGVITAGAQSLRLGLRIQAGDGQALAGQFRQIDPKVTERAVSAIEFDGTTLRFSLSKPNVNHMLQPARTGALSEYIQIEETIAPPLVDTLAAWLARN